MMIDKLNGIEPIDNTSRTESVKKPARLSSEDTINISAESQRLSEAYLAKKIAMEAPDVRQDKIDEVRRKLEDPAYIQHALEEIANKFLSLN